MKKIFFFCLCCSLVQLVAAQHVGIGTATPKARLHVADSSVLFSGSKDLPQVAGQPPVSGSGIRTMWYADKAAFRTGEPFYTEWDKDSIGYFSFAAGRFTKAKGFGSFAAGTGTHATGASAIAMGYRSKALGDYSFATGYESEALDNSAIVLGPFSRAIASNSIAMGFDAEARAEYSVAMNGGVSSGKYSIALGPNRTVAYNCTALGMYNDTAHGGNRTEWIGTDPLLIVGNGKNIYNLGNALLILKNGNMGIGTNTIQAKTHIAYNSALTAPQLLLEETANDYARLCFKNSASNNLWTIAASPQVSAPSAQLNIHYQATGDVFQVYGSGNAWLRGTLTQNSDSRLKKNIQPLGNALSALQKINGYRYEWKDSNRDSAAQVGVLAQEIQAVFPELVKEDAQGILSVNYMGLVPVLISALKEEDRQLQQLRSDNKELLQRIEALERIVTEGKK